MPRKAQHTLLIPFCLVASAVSAFAIAQDTSQPAPAPTPAPTPSPAPASDALPDPTQVPQAPVTDLGALDLLKSAVHAHYHTAPWAEELTLELVPANAPARRTVVRIACDPAPSPASGPSPERPSLRLELDALTIVATPSRLIAINADAPDVAFETALSPTRPFLDQLAEILPALPFPQLHLALNPDSDQAWARAIASIAPTAGTPLHERLPAPDDVSGVVLLTTTTDPLLDPNQSPDANPPSSSFQARILPDRGGFILLTAHDSFGTTPATLTITCKPLAPPSPDTFSIDLTNRQRVDSLARLRPPEPEIKPGMRLPALGLVDDALALWSPQAAFDAQRSPRNTPIRLALVFYDATDVPEANTPSQADDAFDACLLVRAMADKYRRDEANNDRAPRANDLDPLPRVGVVPVAVFDIAAFGPHVVRNEAIAWSELGTPAAFTSAGQPLLKRFSPTGGVSIVIIDEGQIVRGVIPWHGRSSAQRRDDLDNALRGLSLPRTAPEQSIPISTPPTPTPPTPTPPTPPTPPSDPALPR